MSGHAQMVSRSAKKKKNTSKSGSGLQKTPRPNFIEIRKSWVNNTFWRGMTLKEAKDKQKAQVAMAWSYIAMT